MKKSVVAEIGTPLTGTILLATTNSSASLLTVIEAAVASTVNTSQIRGALITCESNDARISFSVAADNDSSPVGHIIYVGDTLHLSSADAVKSAYIISRTNDAAASLMVTLLK